jgi:hypothetical protein
VPGSVRSPLVEAHDADRLEADLLVGADRVLVVDCRVDRDPVVAALVEEVACDEPDHLWAEAVSLRARRQEEVDAGVPVVLARLLGIRDRADQLAVGLDRERCAFVGLDEILPDVAGVVVAPPARDAGLAQDLEEAVGVVGPDRPEGDPLAPQRRRWSTASMLCPSGSRTNAA